jgi:hypothetical protein
MCACSNISEEISTSTFEVWSYSETLVSNKTITILDITNVLSFLIHGVSEAEFCIRLWVAFHQMGTTDTVKLPVLNKIQEDIQCLEL